MLKEIISDSSDCTNTVLHNLFIKGEYEICLKLIEKRLLDNRSSSEYPLFLKGYILRHQGELKESLKCFQSALANNMNSNNMNRNESLKQIGKSLLLMDKYKSAISIYIEAIENGLKDEDILYNMGLGYTCLKNYKKAIECFNEANELQPDEDIVMAICNAYVEQDDIKNAIKTILDALKIHCNAPELLKYLGALYIRTKNYNRAREVLIKALNEDEDDVYVEFMVISINQENDKISDCILKYTNLIDKLEKKPELWSNLGMCFFSEKKYENALKCMKKALELDPMNWIIQYNLGLTYIYLKQYASASIHINGALNINKKNNHIWMLFGYVLEQLGDLPNADKAYENSLKIEDTLQCRLNYAVTLAKRGEMEKCQNQYKRFKYMLDRWNIKEIEDEMIELSNRLESYVMLCCKTE